MQNLQAFGVILVVVCFIGVSQAVGYNLTDSSSSNDIQTESQKLIPNQDLYLRCNITQINRVTELKWFKIDADGSERKIIPDQDKYKTNDTHNSLTITHAKVKEDAGVYRCEVDLQGTKASEYVYVTSDPWVKPFDKSKNLVQGERLVLTCEVYGYPMPTVSWEKDGEPLKEDDRTSFEAVKNVTNAKLTVQNLDFADRGVYLCNATNSESSQNGSLIVRVKDKLAALWPFLGICAEVAILCIIIFVYEKRRSKQMDEDDAPEKEHMTNSHDHKGTDDVRHRK